MEYFLWCIKTGEDNGLRTVRDVYESIPATAANEAEFLEGLIMMYKMEGIWFDSSIDEILYPVEKYVKTTKEHSSLRRTIPAGSLVTIVGENKIFGYDIMDKDGNCVFEIGWEI